MLHFSVIEPVSKDNLSKSLCSCCFAFPARPGNRGDKEEGGSRRGRDKKRRKRDEDSGKKRHHHKQAEEDDGLTAKQKKKVVSKAMISSSEESGSEDEKLEIRERWGFRDMDVVVVVVVVKTGNLNEIMFQLAIIYVFIQATSKYCVPMLWNPIWFTDIESDCSRFCKEIYLEHNRL